MSFSIKILALGLACAALLAGAATSASAYNECTYPRPVRAPDLFQIRRTGTTATLYWAPVNDNITGYLVSFGVEGGLRHYVNVGFSDPHGANTLTIHNLNPNLSYNFAVRGSNHCAAGDWSSSIWTTTHTGMFFR